MATLGIDIGCISIKMALVEASGGDAFTILTPSSNEDSALFAHPEELGRVAPSPSSPPLLVTGYRRIKGSPTEAALELLRLLLAVAPPSSIEGVRVTGTGGRILSERLGVPLENEFKALARAVGELHPDVSTVFEMGGETSKFILLDRDPHTGRTGIIDYQTNGDCAAGTGSFMDQQANRLLYEIEDVGDVVRGAGKAATIAGRCSVFAKSDMIHAQQKGYQPPEVLKGLCNAVIRNYRGTIAKGKHVDGKVAFVGGVAANKGAVEAMREAFGLDEEHLVVPRYYAWMGAIGAALLEADRLQEEEADPEGSGPRAGTVIDLSLLEETHGGGLPAASPLSMERVTLLRDRVEPYQWQTPGRVEAYLGIDVGSVSTNLVVLDATGRLIKEIYTKTDGRPAEVVHKGLQEIWQEMGDRLTILGVGTTGSGRELIGELVGADTVTDEITAHKTGAGFVGDTLLDGRVPDTIFEIGGQDSKYISLDDGIVVDFAMNQACAAGTGSFLEEQAEKLGINIIGEFADMALSSTAPVRLGERCTVFMERDVNSYQQRGAAKGDLVAGLAYSIVHNYLNRLVAGRKVGDTIYFQGGTAYNDSVAAAFSQILGKEIIVPPHNGVLGAVGMALLAKEKVEATGAPTRFRGFDLEAVDYQVREFTCRGCTNECDIRQFTIEGEKTYWGDKCSDRYRKRAKVDKQPVVADLLALRERLLLSYVTDEVIDPSGPAASGIKNPRGVVGIPRAMYTYDRLPFWATFFKVCGFDVLVSGETDRHIREAGIESTVAEPCFPIRAAHGHVLNLVERGADYVFVPNLLNEETDAPEIESHCCPWGQTLPYVVLTSPAFEALSERVLRPTLHFRRGPEFIKEALASTMRPLGVRKRLVEKAADEAYAAQEEFRAALLTAGKDALATLAEHDELGIVLIGRPYNMYDPGANMDIPHKLRKFYGVNLIPLDFLPLWSEETRDVTPNMFWNYGRKILQALRVTAANPHLHVIYLTNFKCGPDSYIKQYARATGIGPFLTLQFDEHTNDAGAMTRCEAYLDSKGFLRWWTRDRNRTEREAGYPAARPADEA
jgi:predicted CoA-substrate-specific enzyme activase